MRNRNVKLFLSTASAMFFALTNCTPSGSHRPVAGAKASIKGGVGYDSVKPIFAGVCAKCHPSQHGPDWLDLKSAQANAQLLKKRVVDQQDMPPPSDPAAALVTQKDRDLIGAWVAEGAPEVAPVVVEDAKGAPGSIAQALFRGQPLRPFVQQCSQCHGAGAPSANAQSDVPYIAGLNREYLQTQLLAFRSGERQDPSNRMNKILASPRISLDDIDEAADYYASLVGLKTKAADAVVVDQPEKFEAGRRIAQRSCVQCHAHPGPNDNSVPLINGQSEEYLTNQLKNFRNAKTLGTSYRARSLMVNFASTLSEADIENLAYYFSVAKLP